jgi:hypothetical protein
MIFILKKNMNQQACVVLGQGTSVRRIERLQYLVIIICLIGSIAYPLFGNGVFRNPLELFSDQDVLFTFYPVEHYFFEYFKEHNSIPQYNFLNGIGYTFASDGQFGQFYLIKYLLLRLSNSFEIYGTSYYIFHEVCALITAFLLADSLYSAKLSKWLFVILYINASIFVIWIGFAHVLPFLAFCPLVIYGFSLLYKSVRTIQASIAIGFGLGMVAQGGHLSNLYYLGLVAAIYSTILIVASRLLLLREKIKFVVITFLSFLLVSFPTLYGFLEAESYHRAYMSVPQISITNFILNLFIFHGNYPDNNEWQNGYLYFGPIAFFY